MHVQIFVQAQRVLDVARERIQAIEPSRRPKASPYFRASVGLEQQGLARRDTEQPSRPSCEQGLVNHFFRAQASDPVYPPAGRRSLSRHRQFAGFVSASPAKGLRRLPNC